MIEPTPSGERQAEGGSTAPSLRCVGCRYDLSDQPTYFVEEYYLQAVRCPECGRVQPAGIQARSDRHRALQFATVGALWVLLLFVGVIGTAAAIGGMAQSTAYAACHPISHEILDAFRSADPPALDPWGSPVTGAMVTSRWWESEGRARLSVIGGLSATYDWAALTDWLWFLLIAPFAGFLLHALLVKARAPVRAAAWLAIAGLSAAGIWVYFAIAPIPYLGYMCYAPEVATDFAGQPVAWATYGIGLSSTALCFFLAPAAMRGVSVAMGRGSPA